MPSNQIEFHSIRTTEFISIAVETNQAIHWLFPCVETRLGWFFRRCLLSCYRVFLFLNLSLSSIISFSVTAASSATATELQKKSFFFFTGFYRVFFRTHTRKSFLCVWLAVDVQTSFLSVTGRLPIGSSWFFYIFFFICWLVFYLATNRCSTSSSFVFIILFQVFLLYIWFSEILLGFTRF